MSFLVGDRVGREWLWLMTGLLTEVLIRQKGTLPETGQHI